MSKIKIEEIRAELEQEKWSLISNSYKNLDSELIVECPEGHRVYSTWKKLRIKKECPVCKQNIFNDRTTKIIPKKKDTYRVLALDQATYVSGFSIYDDKKLIRYGTFETALTEEIARDDAVRKWLISMIANWKPDLVAIEDIQMQQLGGKQVYGSDNVVGIQTFKTLAHLQGILMETCYEMGIDFLLCPTPTWRAHCQVKGKTRADKKRSLQLLVKDWFDVSVTEDEADAIGIGKYASETHTARKVEWQDWE